MPPPCQPGSCTCFGAARTAAACALMLQPGTFLLLGRGGCLKHGTTRLCSSTVASPSQLEIAADGQLARLAWRAPAPVSSAGPAGCKAVAAAAGPGWLDEGGLQAGWPWPIGLQVSWEFGFLPGCCCCLCCLLCEIYRASDCSDAAHLCNLLP